MIERNLLLNAAGFQVFGNGLQASFNAIAGTHVGSCLGLDGGDGLISHNVAVDCGFGGLSFGDAVDTTVLGNLVDGLPDESGGILGFGIPENSDDPEFPGNLRTIIRHNIIRLTSGSGMDVGASQALIEGNFIDRTANDPNQAGIVIEGNGNQVLHNLVRNSSFSAIHVRGPFFDASLGDVVPSSGNLIQGNILTRSHTAGILFEPGVDAIVGSDDTTVDGNLISFNDGEGVAIPVDPLGPDRPAATGVTLTDNTFEGNRTDVCDEGGTVVDGGGNLFGGGGIVAECVVEPGFIF